MVDTPKAKSPLIIELDQTPLPDAPSPAEAPQPAEVAPRAGEQAIAAAARSGGWGLGRWLLSAAAALFVLWIGISVETFITGLFASHGWLGWVGLGLAGLLAVLLIVLILRELAALSRLHKIEDLRAKAVEAIETGSTEAGTATVAGLNKLYRRRPDMEWALGEMKSAEADTPDAAGRLAIAERTLMASLDDRAEAAIMRASRDVAAATALIPLAFVDVLAALTCNLRMVRQIAEIYGGRAGWLGSWRLTRAVAAHLVATGAVAVADDLLGPLVGGGVLAKLSRRFGEGALNGALTARVGVAAMDICRPLPFVERDRPSASGLVLSALKAWRREDDAPAS
ncbi:MAG: TIGR01620 family protein [Pseudomonadota bacterium]